MEQPSVFEGVLMVDKQAWSLADVEMLRKLLGICVHFIQIRYGSYLGQICLYLTQTMVEISFFHFSCLFSQEIDAKL